MSITHALKRGKQSGGHGAANSGWQTETQFKMKIVVSD
jgi:hypothetical protein